MFLSDSFSSSLYCSWGWSVTMVSVFWALTLQSGSSQTLAVSWLGNNNIWLLLLTLSERHTYCTYTCFWRDAGCHTGCPGRCCCGGLSALLKGTTAGQIFSRQTRNSNWQTSGYWLTSLTSRLPAAPIIIHLACTILPCTILPCTTLYYCSYCKWCVTWTTSCFLIESIYRTQQSQSKPPQ